MWISSLVYSYYGMLLAVLYSTRWAEYENYGVYLWQLAMCVWLSVYRTRLRSTKTSRRLSRMFYILWYAIIIVNSFMLGWCMCLRRILHNGIKPIMQHTHHLTDSKPTHADVRIYKLVWKNPTRVWNKSNNKLA